MIILSFYRYDETIARQEKMLAIGLFLLYATVLLHDTQVSD